MLGEIREITDFLTFVGGQMDSPPTASSSNTSGRNPRQRLTGRRRYASQFPGHRIGRSRFAHIIGKFTKFICKLFISLFLCTEPNSGV